MVNINQTINAMSCDTSVDSNLSDKLPTRVYTQWTTTNLSINSFNLSWNEKSRKLDITIPQNPVYFYNVGIAFNTVETVQKVAKLISVQKYRLQIIYVA